jgi:nucleotide-binding universal stress UspA family protein/RimJ/RimL family protein N-acetyltransferase
MSTSLPDGSRITIRPIGPEDRQGLADGFARLSPETRYRRFFSPVPELRERDLDYLTQIDHRDHEALVAIDDATGEGVGVARYVRISDGLAEPAVVVVDDWHGRGVGGALLSSLVDRARQEGVTRFQAPVLATNNEAIRALEKLGETRSELDGREVMLTIDLPPAARPPGLPDLTELLRSFATGALQPARTLLQLVWPHRHGEPGDERRNVILVGTNGSSSSELVMKTAGEVAVPLGATVHVLGVHRFLAGHEPELTTAVRRGAAALRDHGLEVNEEVRRGDAALILSDVAIELNVRMIVVGAGDRGKTARRILGSVADLVAERAPCSVLIVRPREQRD